jgi:hypothetical protein
MVVYYGKGLHNREFGVVHGRYCVDVFHVLKMKARDPPVAGR